MLLAVQQEGYHLVTVSEIQKDVKDGNTWVLGDLVQGAEVPTQP